MTNNTRQTDFQRNKILRDTKIVQLFNEMTGAVTVRITELSIKFRLTPNMIYKILQTAKNTKKEES